MDIELPRDFREFLSVLNARGVEYLLIGGYGDFPLLTPEALIPALRAPLPDERGVLPHVDVMDAD